MDENGVRLTVGDVVELRSVPEHLLRGLPDDDQTEIKNCVGRKVSVVSFDAFGNVELAFIDSAGDEHSIWVPGASLRKS